MRTSVKHSSSKCVGRSTQSIAVVFLVACNLALAGCAGLLTANSTNPPPTALAISNLGSSNDTTTSASVSWQTNVPANSLVEYGATTSYGSATVLDSTMITNHQQNLSSLKPATTYHFRVHSTDASNNTAVSSDSTFSTTADTAAPTVSITAPANGATVSGTVTVAANATDNVSVATVQFQLDGASLGSAIATAPYSASWDTTKSTGGQHTLSAIARDAAGNSATSANVIVTVSAAAIAPAITTQPGNQTVTAGQTATFGVAATGTAPLSYQWKKNGANISGATSASYTTPATTTADNGSTFVVAVSNTAGTATSTAATLTVSAAAIAPAITTQPGNQTVTAGQTATFGVAATGTAPLSYQWKKNGANISGATSASYTTPATTTADNGSTFVVAVSNTAGTATSTAATLTVSAAAIAPAITTQPGNQTVTAGQTATFGVAATGTAPLSYQWKKNGANISGATSASYTTPATTTADNGSTFVVAVSNTAGTATSTAATLTVSAAAIAPAITTQPGNQTVTAGQTATFGVAATGTAPLSYQWKKNGANISGATSASYTTPATTTADNGSTFVVAVSNTAGTATSTAATLTVSAAAIAPAITTQPGNQTVTAGQTATFGVAATGTAPLSYQWKKNGANISGATSASYTTPATTTADNGSTFVVAVSNTAGTATSTAATLTVSAAAIAPAITTQPGNQTVTAGQTATFGVAATGTAPLSYQWKKNGANISGATSASYTTPATTTADNGSTFVVAVSNTAGTATSTAATLTVSAAAIAPAITTQPGNQTVTAGQTATFGVAATGTAPLSYQWKKNGANISGATSASYTTPATTTADNGSTFVVAVSNTAGSVTSNIATLTVNSATSPPGVPTSLAAGAASSSEIDLNWNASTGSVAGYKIFRGGSQVGTSTTTSYADMGLTASTTYSYTVSAFDASGNTSAQSTSASATTLQSTGGGGGQIPSTLGWFDIPNTKFQSVQQTSWSQNVSGDPANVMAAWGGGTYDSKRNRLIVWGGGHGDYKGNEVYVLDLNANPIVPLRLNNPDQYSPDGTCHDSIPGNSNRPSSRHTYDTLAYLPTQDALFNIGGSQADSGCFGNDPWTFSFTSLNWTPFSQVSGWIGGPGLCDFDPNKGLVHCFNNGIGSEWDVNPSTMAFTEQSTETGGFPSLDLTGVLDYDGKRHYLIGGGWMAYYNVAGNAPYPTRTDMAVPSSCSTFASGHYPGLAYDPVQKVIVEWHGGNQVNIYNPATNTCSSQNFTGGPGAQQANGTHGRFRYVPALGVFVVCNAWAQDCFSLRLTAGGTGGTSGPVFSGVGAGSITTSGATIGWTTDVGATTQVEYGTTIAYGTSTTLNATLVTSHSAPLTGLSVSTLYHYRVHSKNSAGTESVSGDFAFSTNNTTDTTPPSVSISSPSGGATVGGTLSVTASASDNIGVASVQFLLDGANLGALLTTAPYSVPWNSTTAANGSHTLSAQAKDSAGNVGTSIGVSVTVSNSTSSADQNFQLRCASPGVLSCQGFDSAATFTQVVGQGQGNLTDGFSTSSHPNITRDTTVFVSGGASANYLIPAASGENDTGNWWSYFGQGANNQYFGQNSTFFVQFAFRADSAWTNTDWTQYGAPGDNTAPKLVIFHNDAAGSCAEEEITTHNHNAHNLPTIYSECGSRQALTGSGGINYDESGGSGSLLFQQGFTEPSPFTGYDCDYNNGAFSGPNCFHFTANQWYTLYYKITVGTFGSPNSAIEAWVAPYGSQLKKFINVHNYTLTNDTVCTPSGGPGGTSPCKGWNTLEFTEFMTAKGTCTPFPACNNSPAAHVWYDELIISSQPIPAPAGSTP